MYKGRRDQPRSTDTLHVRVSEIQYTVDENVVLQVFNPVGAVSRVHMLPQQGTERVAIVQFGDVRAAEAAMNERNGRNIFNNCCKMTISFTNWESFVPPQPSSVLPQPTAISPQMMQPQQQFIEGPYAAQAKLLGQQQQPGAFFAPPQQHQLDNFQQQQLYPSQSNVGVSVGRGGGMPQMGGMGRGGGIYIPTASFNPMGMGMGMGMMRGGMFNPLLAGAPLMQGQQQQQAFGPTVYASVAIVPESASLFALFTILEVFGGVVFIRRNQNKREITTVKMASTQDTETISKYLRQTPFFGVTVSAKPFPSYNERNPATSEGDPRDASVVQYDFTNMRHRNSSQRCRCSASNLLKLTGVANHTESSVMSFFNERNFYPERLVKDEAEGYFTVQMDTTENAVKLILECQWAVCGEEKSNLVFTETAGSDVTAGHQQPQNS